MNYHSCVGPAVLIVVASTSSADIINVPGDQPTIQAACACSFVSTAGYGKVVADSFMPGYRNIGCPYTEEEIAALRQILAKVADRMTTQEIEKITATLGPDKKKRSG